MARQDSYQIVDVTFVEGELPPPLTKQAKTNWGRSLTPLKGREKKWAFLRAFSRSSYAHAMKRAVATSLEKSGEDLLKWEFTVRPLPEAKQEEGKWGVFGRYVSDQREVSVE